MKSRLKIITIVTVVFACISMFCATSFAQQEDQGPVFRFFSSGGSGGSSSGHGGSVGFTGSGGGIGVPEPSTLLLMATGLGGLAILYKVRKR